MHELADRLTGTVLTADVELEREFEERLAESATLAVRVAYSVVRNRADAEDVAQEAFAKAYRAFRRLRDREMFRSWLVRVAWRTALDHRRAARRREARETANESTSIGSARRPDTDLLARELEQRLWQAIDALPEKLRMVIVLANIEEHDIGEVAALLRLPHGTVKSRLHLARQRLKELLQ